MPKKLQTGRPPPTEQGSPAHRVQTAEAAEAAEATEKGGGTDPMEREMATHSSTLAWRIPWIGGAWWAIVHRIAKSWPQL